MPPATAGASAASARERLLDMLAPLVAAAGLDLEDISVTKAGRRNLVRLTVDADGGIDSDTLGRVSRQVGDALDGDEPFAGAYVLEVSSPGVDRPLTDARHWRRAAGRLVSAPVAGRPLTGRVLAAEDDAVVLDVDGRETRVRWAELGPGKVQVEFNRAGADDLDANPADEGD